MNDNGGSELKNLIKDAFKKDALLASYTIEAEDSDGNITLTGTVPGHEEKVHAQFLVSAMPGVESITNNITIESGGETTTEIPLPDMTQHQDAPGSSGAFPVGAFDTSKD